MKLLKPIIIKPKVQETPQCDADVDMAPSEQWRIDRYRRMRPDYNPLKCQRPSTIEIDGRCYCRMHAAGIALEMWITGDLVQYNKEYEE